MNKIKIAVSGATGKVGKTICDLARDHGCDVTEEFSRNTLKNKKPAKIKADVVIDFSQPEFTLKIAEFCAEQKTPLLVCTTGFNDNQMAKLKATLKGTPWAFVPNTSLGVFALTQAIQSIAPLLSEHFDEPIIIESHHKLKVDAPSGTAKLLQSVVNKAVQKKSKNEILSIRAGTDVGTHTISWYGPYEEIHFTHKAQDRRVFAVGALQLAKKLVGLAKKPDSKNYPLGLQELYQ